MISHAYCLLGLLGKAGDWITVVVMAVGFVVWLIAQLAGQGAKAAEQRRKSRRMQPQRPVPPPRRPQPQRPVSRGSRPSAPPRRPTPPPRRPTPPRSSESSAPAKKLGTLERKPAVKKKKVSTLEEHHLQTTIKPQTASLPEGTVPSDLQIHVEQTFAHDSGGQLPSEQRPEAEPQQQEISPVAQEIINTLRNPQDVRKAVVIAEILRRPEF